MTKDEILKVRNVVYERSVHCSGCYLVDQTAGKGAYIKCSCGITEALAILDAAISEPEQEPVAYLNDRYMTLHSWHPGIYRTAAMIAGELQPLYTAPPAPQSAQPVGPLNFREAWLSFVEWFGKNDWAVVDNDNFRIMFGHGYEAGRLTAPPSREWVELTEADKRNLTHQTLQVFQAALRADGTGRADPMTLINFTEQLLRAKNSGEQA